MQIIPVASGKGGVGKSLFSANLAIALGKAGKKVLLIDLDLGASNLHLVIGQSSPKAGIGTYLTGLSDFEDIIFPTDYENVRFIAGDSEIPGLTSLKVSQKNDLIKKIQSVDADYVILDLGAGTHLTILDMFLSSPKGIIVTAPTVTATLNGYLFLKHIVFRMMYNTFRKDSKAFDVLEKLKIDSTSLQKLYLPKLIETLEKEDPESTRVFKERLSKFHPRIVLNMIDDPKDAEKALKIRHSCSQYLGLELEHLGIIYRDQSQDKALAARLPVIAYKPNAVISQAIFRIADKIIQAENTAEDESIDAFENADNSFDVAQEEANDDYSARMTYIEELVGSGALTMGELAETLKTQQYEITSLKNENALLKKKLLEAAGKGFKI